MIVTDPVPREPRRSEIIHGLITLRKSGELQGVWVDSDVIRVRESGLFTGAPSRLTWKRAAEMIERAAIAAAERQARERA
jgi:hypothetical protein